MAVGGHLGGHAAAARSIEGCWPRPPLDSLAIRIDGKRAWDTTASIRWHFTDTGETYRMELSNGALIHYPTSSAWRWRGPVFHPAGGRCWVTVWVIMGYGMEQGTG